MTTIDFNRAIQDAKSASFEALPIGDYDVETIEATATRSSNGKPMIKAKMRVIVGPYAQRTIFNNFVLSVENPQAMAIFFRHMKCFGLTEEFFAALGSAGSMDTVASTLVGRRARLTLGIRQWNGEDRNDVTQVKPYTGAPSGGPTGPAPLSPATAGPAAASVAPAPAPTPAPLPAPTHAPTPPAATPQPLPPPPTTSQPVTAAPVPPPSATSPVIEATPFVHDAQPAAAPQPVAEPVVAQVTQPVEQPAFAVPTDGGQAAPASPSSPQPTTSEPAPPALPI